MSATKYKHTGTAYTNPFENLERAEVRIKAGSARIARIVFLNGDRDETNTVKQLVNLGRSDNFVDGKVVPSVDRAGAKVRLKVYFNKPGSHRFTVKCEPLDGNSKYSPGELARNSRFGYQKEQKSYTTAGDGSLILPLDDFYVGAAGKDKYVFHATDENGITVSTGNLEVHRLIYYVEIKMRSLTTCATNLELMERTYAKHNIKLARLPAVEMDFLPNIGMRDAEIFQENARRAYSRSSALGKQPQVIAIAYTGHLAIKKENFQVGASPVVVGPGSSPVLIPVGDPPSAKSLFPVTYFLWQGLVPGENWFVSAKFIKTGGNQTSAVDIPAEKCKPVPSTSAIPQRANMVRIDVSSLQQGTGTIVLVVNVVERMRAGLSFRGGNLICVCTKAWWTPVDIKTQNEIVVHEIGHSIGMVPDGSGKLPDRLTSYYDDAKGHVGNHCFYGLPANQNRYDSPSDVIRSKCVMYGSANGVSDFCINCAPAVRKVDLSEGWRAF